MATIASMIYNIEANTTSIERSMANVSKVVDDAEKSMTKSITTGVSLGEMFEHLAEKIGEGFLKVAEALPQIVEHTIELGNQLYDMSLKTGASVENLSALRYVASQTGIDFAGFGNTLFKMEQALGSSGAKADELQKHLDLLHLDLNTLKNERPDQAFIDILSALEKLPNRMDQAAVGAAIFGKGWKEMAQLATEDIRKLIDEANELGLVMTTDQASAAHAAEVGWQSFSMQLEAAAMQIADSVLPSLVAVESLLSREFQAAVRGGTLSLGDMDAVVKSGIETLLRWADIGVSIAQFIDNAFQGVKAMFFDVTAKVVDLTTAFVHLLEMGADLASKTPLVGAQFLGVRDALKDTRTWLDGFAKGLHDESDGAIDAAGKHATLFNALHTGVADLKQNFGSAFDDAKKRISDFAAVSHAAIGGVGEDLVTGENAAKALDERLKNIAASEALMVKAMASVLVGPQQILRDMATAEGNLRLPGITVNAPAQDMGKTLTDALNQTVLAIPDLSEPAKAHMKDVLGNGVVNSLASAFAKFPTLLTDAFTGGGNLAGALKGVSNEISNSLFGKDGALHGVTNAVSGFVSDAFSGLGKTASGIIGGLAGSILPGLGGLISSALGMLMHIGGPSQTELQGRDAEAQFEKAMGGWQGIQKSLVDTGMTADQANAKIQSLWAAEKQGGAAVQAQIDSINTTLKTHEQDVANISTSVDAVTASAKNLGTTFPTALQPMVDKLLSLPGLTDDEQTALKGLVASTAPDMNSLEQMASGLGITLAQLGPKFQQSHIDTLGNSYADSFKKLVDAGGDVDGIIEGMSPKILDVVHNATKFGVDVPESMKPMLQKMIDMGTLTDDTGKKITDLNTLHFDDSQSPLDAATSKLTDALNHLSDLLSKSLPSAAAAAASGITTSLAGVQVPDIHVPIHFDIPDAPGAENFAAGGGMVTSNGIVRYFGAGGNVLPFMARGTDTVPAMLTPGERVLNRQEAAAYNAGARTGGTAVVIEFHHQTVLDGRVLDERTERITKEMAASGKLVVPQRSVVKRAI